MKKKNNQWMVAAVFLILGFLLTYQYQQRQEPVRTLTIEETELLLQEIASLEGEKEALLQKNRELLQDVKNFETAAASSSEAHALLKEELDRSRHGGYQRTWDCDDTQTYRCQPESSDL
ncbi:hypothetical protein [Proteiniclasticum ruminis]|uniref:hypothetical protein n=1 Tax=Proteiniclasticum ruminis TaxID=398199 RepID=UPI0028AFDBA0|nr:hypothetical protein [Proteiniclasticum ruminis]